MPDDVDPRYSLANERTFLAWVRTALGLLAAAAAIVAIDLPWPEAAVRVIAGLLALTAGGAAVLAWTRWRRVEEAIAAGSPVPEPRSHLLVALVVAAVAGAVVVLVVVG